MHTYRHHESKEEINAFLSVLTGQDASGLAAKQRNKLMNENHDMWKLWCASRNYAISEVLTGKSVSLDVSTGEEDIDHRIYGTVLEAMDDDDGFVLLVEEESRNYDHQSDVLNAKIGKQVWNFIDRMGDHCAEDPADKILDEFVAAVTPIFEESVAHIYANVGKDELRKLSKFRREAASTARGECLCDVMHTTCSECRKKWRSATNNASN